MKTLKELQENLPWGAHTYSADFQADPRRHRDCAHALQHILKAAGKLAAVLDEHDHGDGPAMALGDAKAPAYLADLLLCTVRMANTFPGARPIDLSAAIDQRIADKFPPMVPYVEGHAKSLPPWRMMMGATSELPAGAAWASLAGGQYRYHDWRGKTWCQHPHTLMVAARAPHVELVYWSNADVDRTDPGVFLGVATQLAVGGSPDIVLVCALTPGCEVQP